MKFQKINLLLIFLTYFFSYELNYGNHNLSLVTEEWPPYNYLEDNELTGFSVEIVRYIMKDLNINDDVKVFPGNRSAKMLDSEKRVMFFSMFRTPRREKKYKWIGPLTKDKFYFYKKRGNTIQITSLEDAKKVKKISSRSTGLVYDYLIQNGFENLDVSINNESIYLKLIAGRVDLGIAETPVGVAYMLNKLKQPADILVRTELGILEYSLYIAASKDISDFEVKKWQNSLDRMKKIGEYDKIYKKYINEKR